MKLDPESPDVQVAVFGKEVEIFLQSNVGVYLTQCCEAEITNAVEKLKYERDMNKITELQNCIWRAESVMGWLGDAMRSGTQAQELIREAQ